MKPSYNMQQFRRLEPVIVGRVRESWTGDAILRKEKSFKKRKKSFF